MKYKFVRDKKSGETRIDYYKVIDKETFRFETLKRLLTEEDLILSLDTNLVKSNDKQRDIAMGLENHLKEDNFLYQVLAIPNTKEKKIFGIPMKSGEENAYNILVSLSAQDITKDFFDQYIKGNDVLMGIQPKKSFEEIYQDLQKGYMTSFFNKAYFEYTLYDSIFISSLRINKTIEAF